MYRCNAETLHFDATDGELSSPGWPSDYTAATHCEYILTFNMVASQRVILNFTHFEVDGYKMYWKSAETLWHRDWCPNDYLQVCE